MTRSIGLVLTGGGGRSAYQVGALEAVAEVALEVGRPWPCEFLTGTSAGAINTAFLAQRREPFLPSVKALGRLWDQLETERVYRTDFRSLSKTGVRWLGERSFGALMPRGPRGGALLDTSPLRELLTRELEPGGVERSLKSGRIAGVAINALDYCCGENQTFYQSREPIVPWRRARRSGGRRRIGVEEVMASASIPIMFPPVMIDGHPHGDGAVRNYAPLSAPIKLGARKLLVIGVRRKAPAQPVTGEQPSVGRIASVLLNSTLLDGIDIDLERLETINRLLRAGGATPEEHLQTVEAFVLRPQADLGVIAAEEAHHLPRLLRHLIRGLGEGKEVADLISYLQFEGAYTRRLRRLGYQDTIARRQALAEFLAP